MIQLSDGERDRIMGPIAKALSKHNLFLSLKEMEIEDLRNALQILETATDGWTYFDKDDPATWPKASDGESLYKVEVAVDWNELPGQWEPRRGSFYVYEDSTFFWRLDFANSTKPFPVYAWRELPEKPPIKAKENGNAK